MQMPENPKCKTHPELCDGISAGKGELKSKDQH